LFYFEFKLFTHCNSQYIISHSEEVNLIKLQESTISSDMKNTAISQSNSDKFVHMCFASTQSFLCHNW